MTHSNLKISTQKAESIALPLFNVQGSTTTQLPSEIDLNFRIKVTDRDGYILKISRPDEDGPYLDFQQQYLEKSRTRLVAPKLCPDIHGDSISEITDRNGNNRKVRLLNWIPGRIWSDVNSHAGGAET